MTVLTSYKECPKCGDNHKAKPFCIYENGYHCFSCGYTKNADRSFSTRDFQVNIPKIPDCTFNPDKFLLENLKQLAKWYITKEDLVKHHIGECPNGSIVFPNIIDGVVVFYQQRWYFPRRVLSGGSKIPMLSSIQSHRLVIVEDPISYIRLSNECDVVCLWGTKAPFCSLKQWFNDYTEIRVWLDNDASKETNSGQIAANKICNILKSVLSFNKRKFGFGGKDLAVIKNIVTELDPKCYSPYELREILGEYNDVHAKK